MLFLLSSGFSRKFPRYFVILKNVLTFRLIIASSAPPSFTLRGGIVPLPNQRYAAEECEVSQNLEINFSQNFIYHGDIGKVIGNLFMKPDFHFCKFEQTITVS